MSRESVSLSSDGEPKQDVHYLDNVDSQRHRPIIDPAVEKRILRKIDLRLPLITFCLYLLAFLDRSNIGNAEVAGMQRELGLSSKQFTWLLTIFYIAYIVFEFQALLWKFIPPRYYTATAVFIWGTMSTCQAAAKNWNTMMGLRFIMGTFESAFGPGIPYIFSFFYKRREIGLRCGFFLSAAPLATSFSGLLAYAITSGHALIPRWRLLFLVEGLPTIAAAPIAFFLIPNSAHGAKFLTIEERAVVEARSDGREDTSGKVSLKDTLKALLDFRAWVTAFAYFACNVSFASLPVFLPTILADMGFNHLVSQGLTAPPFFLAFLVTLLATWVSDRLQQRGIVIAITTLIGGIGYVILATCRGTASRYVGVFLAACGAFPSISNMLPWSMNNQGSDDGRGVAVVVLNTIGQCGSILGINIFPASEAPGFPKGMWICAGFMFFAFFATLALRSIFAWENRKLDALHGRVDARRQSGIEEEEGQENKGQAIYEENFGETYRYVL